MSVLEMCQRAWGWLLGADLKENAPITGFAIAPNQRQKDKQTAAADQAVRLRVQRQLQKEERCLRMLQEQSRAAVMNGDGAKLARSSDQLLAVVERVRLLRRLLVGFSPTTRSLVFPAQLLLQSYALCCETPDEGMHLVIGVELEGLAVATNVVPLAYEHRSIAAARGDHRDSHRKCIAIHEAGYRVLALLHSHPGAGPNANLHSAEDSMTQRLWEQATNMVSGIWSRDGYLRFFSCSRPFLIQIAGNHMEQLDNELFRITEDAATLAVA